MSAITKQPGTQAQTNTPRPTGTTTRKQTGSRVELAVVGLVGVATTVVLLFALMLALGWRQQPFFGATLNHTLVVNANNPAGAIAWTGLEAGLQRGDHIRSLNGRALAAEPNDYAGAFASFTEIISHLSVGDNVLVEFDRVARGDSIAIEDGQRVFCAPVTNGTAACTVSFRLMSVPQEDFIIQFVVPYISAVIALFIGFFVLAQRWYQSNALLVALVSFLMALLLGLVFDQNSTNLLTPLWLVATAFLGGAFGTLALTFPNKSSALYRQPNLRYVPFGMAALLSLAFLVLYYFPPYPQIGNEISQFVASAALLGIGALAVSAAERRGRATSLAVRDQSNSVLIGVAMSVLPVILWLINLAVLSLTGTPIVPFNIVSVMTFFLLIPISLAYAVLQYRAFDTDRFISQSITYGIMMLALILGYFLLVFGAALLVRSTVAADNIVLMALAIFLAAVLFVPVRSRMQRYIDRIYFRTEQNYQAVLEEFTGEITSLTEIDEIVDLLQTRLDDTVKPQQSFVFLTDATTDDYFAHGDPTPTDIRFESDSQLIVYLSSGNNFVNFEPGVPWKSRLLTERMRLQILGARMIAALPGSAKLNGFVVLGAPLSREDHYPYEAQRFVQNMVGQASNAVERAQVVQSLERRVRELDIIGRISKSANFAVDFDVLLEFIDQQTNQLIDKTHFYIVLIDQTTRELYYAFFVENNERFPLRENRRWQMGGDLYSEIVRTEKSYVTPSYVATQTELGYRMRNEDEDLRAWVGVPLIAGKRTLGVMAVGTSNPQKVYSEEEIQTINDIGALVASSLDNVRLFAETELRARQLTALNKISQELVMAELDLDVLLELILRNSVEILRTEAGSLLLTTDDESGDLEFRVVIGGTGDDLVGKRLPAGRGLVGKVASEGEVVIVNDAANDPNWGGELSKGSFTTDSVLAVPLINQGRVIGVLELINKRDDGIFNRNDADLLSTFGGQAAVAIENARLFQMTDRQLSARVEELEMLERIDVELNRSLDLARVAEITMRWAIANTSATAGVLGLVTFEPPLLHVVSKYGYGDNDLPEGADGSVWSLEKGIVSRVLRTGMADVTTNVQLDPSYVESLRGGTSQITVPMLQAGEVIAMLVLEKNATPPLGLAELAFIQRLSDHASIAIANAKLYAELERANQSKSEFVSFVAHELKNPLTSIKGYSDVLLNGAVGQLGEQQHNFLSTIRFNAERMNTLVSDLNDVTKLQTNNLRIDLSPVDFRTIVTETLRPLQNQIEDKQQTLKLEIPNDLPPIMADQNRLIQVLTNLVSNAHKYTPAEGVITVNGHVEHDQRDEKGRDLGPMLHGYVRDNGIGMSEIDLSRLFTPYFRSENPLAREQPGTGLGLTITRGIIQRHGGDIWVESQLDVGTTFHFTIPVATEEEIAAADEKSK